MIPLSKAEAYVLECALPMGTTEQVGLWESLGRVLATDISSDINMPPFDKSAVDGYACRKEDLDANLKVVEVIPAGQMPKMEITQGLCSKIMTGAPVPKGANCVIMVEEVDEIDEQTIRYTGKYSKTNIAIFAEDVKEGDRVLSKGSLIEPQHIAILAAVGVSNVAVSAKPKVSILVTGDELVEVSEKPNVGQIRNSNGHQLYSQVIRSGATPIYIGIVDDTESATETAIVNALSQSDIVVLTGGVSMGDFDYVPKVLNGLGVDIKFQTIAVQPGKPTLFGVKGKQLVFGLPGNPVSSLFQFDLLVRTAILRLMGGSSPQREMLKMPIAHDYKRKRSERLALAPAKVNGNGEVELLNYHGSAHIFALAQAQFMVMVPIGISQLKKGDLVNVRSV